MPNYVVVEAPRTAFPQELEERRPLREQVFICLQQWDVDSSSSEDSDDYADGVLALAHCHPQAIMQWVQVNQLWVSHNHIPSLPGVAEKGSG